VGVRFSWLGLAALGALSLSLAACKHEPKPGEGAVDDEAALANVKAEHFHHAGLHNGVDYFHDMDGAIPLTETEVQGRAMWLVWTGGDDRFWDSMVKPTYGTFDLLKIVAGRPESGNARPDRWNNLGVVNEPCYKPAAGPDPNRFGLWLDVRDPACGPDPFADEKLYPGVAYKARGKTLPVGSYYGYSTGIVGLRLFPNPAFDETAARRWDAKRYYEDATYYGDPKLVRPYRVGMACAFCHVGPSPTHPPDDPNNPKWANLSSTVGAQYLWMDRIFYWNWKQKPQSFLYEWLRTFKPGTMDTSLVSTDNINNPRTMNAIYDLPARLDIGYRLGRETLAGGQLDNAQFNDVAAVKDRKDLTRLFDKPTAFTPHVLKDGSDSVGALGALNRVYLNIGLYSEEWMRHFNPVIGGKTVSPIRIADAKVRSPYWQATNAGTPATALFFLKAGRPDRLSAAPGGAAFLTASDAQLKRGREVFADTCARCHSSKWPSDGPKPPPEARLAGSAGPDYLQHFKAWWRWTETPEFKQAMRREVDDPNFLKDNYLSTDVRVPVTLLRTNLCSPLATNALRDNIWDNFSSESYKTLPSVGTVSYSDPYTGDRATYVMPAGGRGYTRPPTLISLWSTAPYLLNNRLGKFDPDPAVRNRVATFDLSIRQLLWPERRDKDLVLGNKVEGVIDRTQQQSWLFLPRSYFPIPDARKLPVPEKRAKEIQADIDARLAEALPSAWRDGEGNVKIGPIPRGTPISALTNINVRGPENHDRAAQLWGDIKQFFNVVAFVKHLVGVLLGNAATQPANDAAALKSFEPLRGDLRRLSKCPDFVVNRGHYFGTAQFVNRAGLTPDEQWFIGNEQPLSDADKEALIAFLKTF
jgi:mono/diheme cytochrome c family protein